MVLGQGNHLGQIGDDSADNRVSPVNIDLGSGVYAVASQPVSIIPVHNSSRRCNVLGLQCKRSTRRWCYQ